MKRLLFIFTFYIIFFNNYNNAKEVEMKKNTENKLANEKSPYLKQHANNPVNWFPWSEEAFNEAKKKDFPIFLSIGYSTCHWCHVMENESFEDLEVANLLNKDFISIKVDREERPDIDSVYMEICQALTGSGGWPLTIIMTPDKKPFFAATYIPKNMKYGRYGMMELLPKIANMWATEKEILINSSEKIIGSISNQEHPKSETLSSDTVNECYRNLSKSFDSTNGGFGSKPKFPTPHHLMFLLRYWRFNNNQKALQMVLKTLNKMGDGGIYDHIGGGFHRYSTDAEWLVPHFEKMLYDQAMLITIYSEGYMITKNELYLNKAKEIANYVINHMTDSIGGFYSAEDADSDGKEGTFYTFQLSELKKILSNEELEVFKMRFGVTEYGNFIDPHYPNEIGKNILSIKNSKKNISEKTNLTSEKINKLLNSSKMKINNYRKKRTYPFKDTKVLTDWNGLMINALSQLYMASKEKKYIDFARKCADFILQSNLDLNKGLMHRLKDGEWGINAYLDDYAFFCFGLLNLYESTFDEKYLKNAIKYSELMIEKFYDTKSGGFYLSSENNLITRKKDIYDGAIPSGNSIAIYNLIKLSRISENKKYEAIVNNSIKYFSGIVKKYPTGFTFFMSNLLLMNNSPMEIIVSSNSDSFSIAQEINTVFIPEKVIFLVDKKRSSITKLFPYLETYKKNTKKYQIYVCNNFKCDNPLENIDDFIINYDKKH